MILSNTEEFLEYIKALKDEILHIRYSIHFCDYSYD